MSHYQIKESVLEKLFELSFNILGRKNSKQEFMNTLSDILSPIERLMIAKRIAIMYLITKNIEYSAISDVLKVSTATIAKYAFLLEKSQGIKKSLTTLLKTEGIKLFFDEFFNLLFPPGAYGVNWKAAWKRKKKISYQKLHGI